MMPTTLHYGSKLPRLRRRLRWVWLGASALVVALVVFQFGPSTWNKLVLAQAKRECEAFNPMGAVEAYHESASGSSRAQGIPRCARTLFGSLSLNSVSTDPMLYLGERVTPSGKSRIVVVVLPILEPRSFYYSTLISSYALVDSAGDNAHFKATYRSAKNSADAAPDVGQAITFYVGHADPQDRSRFVIPYVAGHDSGELEGRLTDGDEVILTYLNGPGAKDSQTP